MAACTGGIDHRLFSSTRWRKCVDGDGGSGAPRRPRPAAAARLWQPRRSVYSSPGPSPHSASRFAAPWLVDVAVRFGPEDYFALMCVAFVTVSATFGDSPVRGLTSLFIGLYARPDRNRQADRTSPARVRHPRIARRRRGHDSWRSACSQWAKRFMWPHAATTPEEKLEPVRGSLDGPGRIGNAPGSLRLRGTLLGFPTGAFPPAARKS